MDLLIARVVEVEGLDITAGKPANQTAKLSSACVRQQLFVHESDLLVAVEIDDGKLPLHHKQPTIFIILHPADDLLSSPLHADTARRLGYQSYAANVSKISSVGKSQRRIEDAAPEGQHHHGVLLLCAPETHIQLPGLRMRGTVEFFW